jgi:hypothetical protein
VTEYATFQARVRSTCARWISGDCHGAADCGCFSTPGPRAEEPVTGARAGTHRTPVVLRRDLGEPVLDAPRLCRSRRDRSVHCWQHGAETWTAACGVTVPTADIVHTAEGPSCAACMTALAAALTDRSEPSPWRD